MVGGALDGEVDRHLQSVAARGIDQPCEIVEVAELRVPGIVPAFVGADGVGAARIALLGLTAVVAALAVVPAARRERWTGADADAGNTAAGVAWGQVSAGSGPRGRRRPEGENTA